MDDSLDTTDTASTPELAEGDILSDLLIDIGGLPDDLSDDTVPESLMLVPVHCSIQWLDHHRRHCRPRRCTHVSGPLRALLGFHNEKAIAAQHQNIFAELWRHPDFLMVEAVRSRILKVEASLVKALDDGPSIAAVRAHVDDEEDGIIRLAGTLWARGLTSPFERRLFRLLPLIAPTEPQPENAAAVSTESEPSEKQKAKERRKKAEARATELEGDIRTLKSKGRDRADQLKRVEKDLERITAARDKADQKVETLQGDLDKADAQIQKLEGERRTAESAARKSRNANDQSRKDLQRLQGQLDQVEQDRGKLTRELALVRTKTDVLNATLDAIPRGKDAIDEFLKEEEERIDISLTISQGGDLLQAKDEHAKREKLETAFLTAYPEYVPGPPAALTAPSSLSFTALGGGAEVGRSAYLLEIGANRVLVDCGIAVGRRDFSDMVPDIEAIGRLDAVILTHAHTDHIGWLPALVRHQEEMLPIYCTEDTASIAPIMLDDARTNYERMMARQQQKASYDSGAERMEEQYSRDDLYDVRTRLHALRYDEPRAIPRTPLTLHLTHAGHILGAASVVLEGGGRRVVISGDISSHFQATVGPAKPPQDLAGEVDLLVLESTYGDSIRDPAAAKDDLIQFVRQVTEHGTALLPSFALGRGQEVLKLLLKAKAKEELDSSVEIWVDGLIRKILPIYVERGMVEADGYQLVGPGERERRFAIDSCRHPDSRAVVVTTSGMLNGGPILKWSEALLQHQRHGIALLGYQDEASSAGGALLKLARQENPPYDLPIRGEDGDEVRLKISRKPRDIGLSAHADQDGLVSFAKSVPAREIALVHGEPNAQEALENRLTRELPGVPISRSGRETLRIA